MSTETIEKLRSDNRVDRPMRRHVVSRILAIVALSFPLAWAGLEIDRHDKQLMETYSHQELLVYLDAMMAHSYLEAFAYVFCAGLLFIVFVEGIAYCLRLGYDAWTRRSSARSGHPS
ncbi:MAG: hypothetical protein IH983_04235 [Planctomycetes bacterium]|nr:hypothetical protein [Planctomycetota bacterium]